MRSFAKFITKNALLVALLSVISGSVGAFYSVQLYKNLRTDFEELLPSTARSVVDLNEVASRLVSIDNLAVLVFSKDTKASKRFVTDLAAQLSQYPPSTISSVEYRIDKELKFFRDRAALYMELGDLEKIHSYIEDRIAYEKELYNPINIFSSTPVPEPVLDFNAMRLKYRKRTSAYDRFPDGFYATPDETKRVVLVYMPGKTSSLDQVHRLKDAVTETVARLNPKSYAPDLEVKYTGGVQDTLEENAALVADLRLSTIIVTVVVTLAMLLFFRAIRATGALVFSLFIGTFWTFGMSFFLVGYLNANSAFLGSIVLGNGINFGIIFLARYLEERRRGEGNDAAIETAITHTATSTWTAALAAGLSYGSLILTGFRGFRQFGIIGLVGMVLCWISAFTAMPAFLTLLDRWGVRWGGRFGPLVKTGSREPSHLLSGAIAWAVSRAPRLIWISALAATVLAATAFTRLNGGIMETDLSHLRSKESIEHGSAYLSRYLDEIFQRYLAPIVILPRSREDAVKIADKLKSEKKAQGDGSLIASVQTIDDFIPTNQPGKIRVLGQIRDLLPRHLFNQLAPQDQRRVRELLRPQDFKPITMSTLPPLVVKKFTEKDGSIGKMVLVEPPLNHETWEGDAITRLISELRSAADSVAPGTPVAGTLPITSDMFAAIRRDGPKATLFALIAVVLLVIVLFRNPKIIGLTLMALFLGVIWLFGIILGLGLKINFLNFIALPITFGIGVDYGVNIFQRYREEKEKDIAHIIRQTGGAVALCSFTTIVGYCSLLIAQNQAFVSFGTLAVAGELTCVTAAIVALPAFLMMKSARSQPRPLTSTPADPAMPAMNEEE